ncbi:MAG TPA: hypothetical protein VES79_11640 [Solirubrobacteraceae bacterium]|nr:hypothetical protein [Solirubrobacteraceae bacterium]
MGCLVFLFALISPRVALVVTWLLTDVLSRAYDGVIVPVLGFLLLPWTTLAYAWTHDSGATVEVEWFLVGLAFFFDLGSYVGGSRSRRE